MPAVADYLVNSVADALLPTQSTSRNVQTKKGNTLYSVSLTECECRSTALKTVRQKINASNHTAVPGKETGR